MNLTRPTTSFALPTALALTLPCFACALPIPGDEGDDGNSPGDSSGSPATDNPTTNPTATATDASESSGGNADESSGGNVDTTGGGIPSMCTDATILAGDPYFTGDLGGWNTAGQPLLADPPLRMRHIADAGGHLAIETQSEVWIADGADVHRIAGDESEVDMQYQPFGACEDVRVIIANGIAGLPGGNLVVADTRGNGLIEITDPLGDCTAAPLAGNPDATFDVDIFDGAAAQGDVDGPGAQARFFGVSRPVADADGNIYVIDSGNAKLKRIADDADRTVSTVFEYGGPDEAFVIAMTAMNGMLYATGQTAVDDLVWAIDPDAPGNETVLLQGRGIFAELDASEQATLFGAANDGVDLLLASNKGYIFRLSSTGEPLGAVAGMGTIVDFPADLDLGASFPLDQVPLRSYANGDADLLRLGSDFVFTGNAGGVGFHLWSIHCG